MALVASLESDTGEQVAWATIAQVSEITGVAESEITDEDIVRALYVIDIKTGRTFDTYDLLNNNERRRDLHFLKLALAYQTVWMKAQPDLYTRMDITSVSQDGVSSQFKPGALELAPLAQRAIKRLSWKGSRSVTVGKTHDEKKVYAAGSAIYDEPGDQWEAM